MESGKPPRLQPSTVAIPFALVLFIGSLALAWHAISYFGSGQTFHGVEFTGFSIMVFSGCLDPINFLWLFLPFTARPVTPPTRFARFRLPLTIIGLFLLVTGRFAG
jgi:hypothetical protein